jgi:tetratricopeptide (TPR) repeat protein
VALDGVDAGLQRATAGNTTPARLGPEPELARGAVIGRFIIVGRLGAGGMGVVLAAYDPALDRKVALKLLRPSGDADADGHRSARLMREAQAMARVPHGNVITVYEVGTWEGQVFIAMELIDGAPLSRWLERPWRRRDVVAAFVQAARGLAAAHAAGLVHRDFKPDNVLVARDGRVVVTDFGIARVPEETASAGAASPLAGGALTREGAVVGTPGYMAPEQQLGKPVDARADQYAFCVALRAAFGPDAPRRLRALVRRGLEHEPAARHPSMTVLADALERGPRWRTPGLLAVGLAATVAALVLVRRAPVETPCHGVAEHLSGVWDGGVRAATRAAFVATNRPAAADTYERVAAALDGYTAAWVAMRTDVCLATQVRGEQSPALLDLRMQCLDRRLGAARALTALFARGPDVEVLARALPAALALEPLDGCGDATVLTAAMPLPRDSARRAWLVALEGRLDAVDALATAGKPRPAFALAGVTALEAGALGHEPARARALTQLAGLAHELERPEARTELEAAVMASAQAHDDARAVMNLGNLVRRLAADTKFAEALALRPVLEAAAARGADERLTALAHLALGEALVLGSRYADGERELRAALAMRERVGGSDALELVPILSALAHALSRQSKIPDARAQLDRGLTIVAQRLGPDHPAAIPLYKGVGRAAWVHGDADDALAAELRVLTLTEHTYGPESPRVVPALGDVVFMLGELGRYAEALAALERARALIERLYGTDSRDMARNLSQRALIELDAGHLPAARSLFERALAGAEKVYPADHEELTYYLDGLGATLRKQGKPADALVVLRRSLATRERTRPPEHPGLIDVRAEVALCLVDLGRAAEALPLLEQARAPLAAGTYDGPEFVRLKVDLALVRVLEALGRDPERVRTLVAEMRDHLPAARTPRRDLEPIRAWLARR